MLPPPPRHSILLDEDLACKTAEAVWKGFVQLGGPVGKACGWVCTGVGATLGVVVNNAQSLINNFGPSAYGWSLAFLVAAFAFAIWGKFAGIMMSAGVKVINEIEGIVPAKKKVAVRARREHPEAKFTFAPPPIQKAWPSLREGGWLPRKEDPLPANPSETEHKVYDALVDDYFRPLPWPVAPILKRLSRRSRYTSRAGMARLAMLQILGFWLSIIALVVAVLICACSVQLKGQTEPKKIPAMIQQSEQPPTRVTPRPGTRRLIEI